MKIGITEEMINGPGGLERTKLLKTPDGYITNGDWLLKEDIINFHKTLPYQMIDKTSKDLMGQFKNANYTDDPDYKVGVNPVYKSIVSQLDNYDNVRVCVAGKTSPIIFLDFEKGEFLGLLMPAISDEEMKEIQKAKSKQELWFMLNDYKKYVDKFDLIPVEYKLEGQEGTCGLFVERNATDEHIKKQIKFAVKQNGGRWLGKFERKPEDKDKLVEKIVAQLSKMDIAEVQKTALEKYQEG